MIFSNASSSDFHPLSAYDIQDRDSRHPHPTPPERRPPGHARPNPPPHHQPPGYRHPNPPPPHQPPRYGRPGPPPPSYYYACYAENYRGQRFVSYGYWPEMANNELSRNAIVDHLDVMSWDVTRKTYKKNRLLIQRPVLQA